MAVVDAALRRRGLGERDHFAPLGEALRGIEQPGRKAERAVAHRLVDQAGHLAESGGRPRAVAGADPSSPPPAEGHIRPTTHPEVAPPLAQTPVSSYPPRRLCDPYKTSHYATRRPLHHRPTRRPR